MDSEQLKHALAGPIASIRTPFLFDGDIDYNSLNRMIDFDIEAGAGALLLTWGDSLFAILSDREIAELTTSVARHCAGRAAVVACTGRWATSQATEFAAHCREAGADCLQVFFPHWYPACLSTESIVAHYQAVATHLPVVANSAEIQWGGQPQGFAIAHALIEANTRIVGMKADVGGGYDRAMTTLVRDHWPMFAGGQKSFHMELFPYGCAGYLSTFVTFWPRVTHTYWQAIQANDVATATCIIEQIDRPFFDYILAMPGGFDAALHGILELHGLAERWRRPPFTSLCDDELERLDDFLEHLKNKTHILGS